MIPNSDSAFKRCLLAAIVLLSGSASFAQDCKQYFYLVENAQVTMTLYDRDNRENGIQTWKVNSVKNDQRGIIANVSSAMTNAKGNEVSRSTGQYRCYGGRLMADMRMLIPPDSRNKNMTDDANTSPAYLEYPTVLTENMELPNALYDINFNINKLASSVHFEINDRKVVGREKLSTAAGTWNAFKITYESYLRVKMTGISIPLTFHVTEWFVPGFGAVKTETYSNKYKLLGSSVLTAFTK